jgi:hypothetical protein
MIFAVDRYFPFAFFGLVLFFFISGFLIEQNNAINRRQDLANFFRQARVENIPFVLDRANCFFIGFGIIVKTRYKNVSSKLLRVMHREFIRYLLNDGAQR